ncbi:MAG: hypothetical protein IKN24_06825 [Lachnospiraceae bacterium]|nr:hypothetical protein [Lachnospiraceae bacterium]
MAKIKKRDEEAKNLVDYTYRDYGQEYIMKRKMVRAIIFAIFAAIAACVFAALYVDEVKRVQETYRTQYAKGLTTVNADIDSYLNAEGDLEFRYRRLVADMNTAASFLFLVDGREDDKKSMQELYTVFLRYPVQTKERLEEIKTAIGDILANLDKGYDEVNAIVEAIDKKGY